MKIEHSPKLMHKPMMKCGHAANAETADGKPCCVICVGIAAGATEIDDHPPDLTGRMARCSCGKEVPSSVDLPFFEFGEFGKPSDHDRYYCGCRGWD